MKELVLVLSNAQDRSTEFVTDHLKRMGQRWLRFNTEEFPDTLTLQLSLCSGEMGGFLGDVEGRVIFGWGEVGTVWYRRPAPAWLPENLPEGYIKFIQGESRSTLWSLYTSLEAFWMNPPLMSISLLEHNKFLQLKEAGRVGLRVPETIITNVPEETLGFCRRHGGVIAVKTIKGKSFTKEGSDVPLFVFTQQVSERELREHTADLRLSPLLAQEYIRKDLEFRVTVVGERVFACAIHSQDSEETKHDWRRYDFDNVKHEPYQLPSDVEEKLRRLMRVWGLAYGAIDMILTPEGEYVFLEINPNGQWQWIEEITGMPISRAMAELLADPPER